MCMMGAQEIKNGHSLFHPYLSPRKKRAAETAIELKLWKKKQQQEESTKKRSTFDYSFFHHKSTPSSRRNITYLSPVMKSKVTANVPSVELHTSGGSLRKPTMNSWVENGRTE